MVKFFQFILLFAGLSLASCNSTKNIVYFDQVKDTTFYSTGSNNLTPLQPSNILSITISSANAEASIPYNLNSSAGGRATTVTGNSTEAGGYLINSDGYILMPVLGAVKAAGLTKNQLQESITNLILSKKTLLNPIVEIRFLNYEVTVIGEVARPTVITVPSESISMLKALGLAGDLTIYGKRENILLIRDEGGKKKTRHIDLSSPQFFNSPYYYLQPNDVVYVAPNKTKINQANSNPQLLPIILSSLSVVVIVLDRLVR